jgi:soluble lytic murein transglycosylase-like protein
MKFQRIAMWMLALLSLSMSAHADVWGYVDERGVAHFASTKLDERYELYFRGQAAPDPKAVAKVDAQSAVRLDSSRAEAAPQVPPKLAAFYELSPNYKTVRPHVRAAAKAHNIDYELLKALITTESGFDPKAISPKGATGLMQLMPATAERMGVVGDARVTQAAKLFDPKTNVNAGARYLRLLINMFPQRLDLALAAYNAGEGAVQRAGNKIPNFKETQDYVRTVTQLYAALKPPPLPLASQATKLVPPSQPDRVSVQLPNRALIPAGTIPGRGNMVPPVTTSPAPSASTAAP